MKADVLLAIDQGTSSTRAIAYDLRLRPLEAASVPVESAHPRPGWVEQDPEAILESVVETVRQVLARMGGPNRVIAVGLANQGETIAAWRADTGAALGPAIVWRCSRSLSVVRRLRRAGHEPGVRALSGLPLDPYFSASKMTWLLEHDRTVRQAAKDGVLRFGTIDAWLTARLDGGDARTDPSTASRTQLFGLNRLDWDPALLETFGIDVATLPRLVPTSGDLGSIGHPRWGGSLPLRAMCCDQQAALAGHGAFRPGSTKATYGTGAFVLANAGPSPVVVQGLETSVGWQLADGSTTSVLQGGVFTVGALFDWLRDGLRLIETPRDIDAAAAEVEDSGLVMMLPALSGLGAPWWHPRATGVISGLTDSVRRGHVVRAAVDGIAHQVVDIVDAITAALPEAPMQLRIDGGLTASQYLAQRQADLLGLPVGLAMNDESTALGIAGLAGMGSGVLEPDQIEAANPVRSWLAPGLDERTRRRERARWRRFVRTSTRL